MKKIILIFSCLIFGFYYTQTDEKLTTKKTIDAILESAEKIYLTNSDKSLKLFLKAHNASKKIDYKKGILQSNGFLMRIFHEKGEDEKTIEYSYETEKIATKPTDTEYLAGAYIQRGISFSYLNHFDESYKEFQKAIETIKKYPEKDKQHYHMSSVYESLVSCYYAPIKAPQDTILTYLKKSLWEAEQIDESIDNIHPDKKYDMISYLNMDIGMFYAGVHKPQRLDLAEQYLKKSLSIINNRKFTKIKINKIPILNALGRFYVEQEKYSNAIEHAYEVLKLEKKQKSPNDRMVAYMVLTNSYEGLNRKDSLIKYMALYTNISDSITHFKSQGSNNLIKKTNIKREENYNSNLQKIILFSSALALIMILGGLFLWKKNKSILHKKYRAIINEIKVEEKSKSKSQDPIQDKGIAITDATTKNLLEKLAKFESSKKFLKKEVSRVYVANYLNTNTRYLSDIIKEYRGKNFNNYINGLRIQYITEMLYNNPVYREYKISFLAEDCGFASREVFAVVFKKETGVTPSYFISQLKNDSKETEL
ncbi:MAG: AraC family transcriptional regulator [Chryseobacterium sp.]|nr:AraC family transcriptional regulator [Chryseobacterium sp.]